MVPGALAVYADAGSAALSQRYDLSTLPERLAASTLGAADRAALAPFAFVAKDQRTVPGLTLAGWRLLADAPEGDHPLGALAQTGYLRSIGGRVYYPTEQLLKAIEADRPRRSARPGALAD